jgi:RES domain-containing protein
VTLRAWRIVKTRHLRDAFSGEGARRFGGRWTSPGVRVVYTAGSQALAALEMLAHLDSPALLRQAYSLVPVEFDARLVLVPKRDALPRGWDLTPAPDAVRAFGDAWVAAGTSAVVQVPSALVADEPNYLLNPAHPAFGRITIGRPLRFRFDHRLGASAPRRRR